MSFLFIDFSMLLKYVGIVVKFNHYVKSENRKDDNCHLFLVIEVGYLL